MEGAERRCLTSAFPVPLKDVAFDERTGIFTARGPDPQMLWRAPKARTDLAGRGAVAVTVAMQAIEGRLHEPSVYADWGDGFSEETLKALSLVSEGVYRGVAYTNAGALRRLRFDPSTGPCAFRIIDFKVEPAAEAAHPAPRLSGPRRLMRAGLRKLPGPAQTGVRRMAAVARSVLRGERSGAGRTRPSAWREAYVRAFEVARNLRSPEYAAPPLSPPPRAADGPRILAFYLPQFHPIPENDAWWSPGFTEWTNVSKATPQFSGHLQPRLPGELGFYDLRVPAVRRRQAELARCFGIDAFCFHYYWFGGKRLLEGPLDAFVDDPEITLPFALCWANENWTRRWDGQEADVLIGQKHSPEDDVAVFDDLARYMRSPRYLRIGEKPLILVYRPDALSDARATMARWRARAKAIGLGDLFIAATNAFGYADYAASGFDALVEFPPHALAIGEMTHKIELLNPAYSGRVYDYEAVVGARVGELLEARDPRRIPGVMPSWDNEARKPGGGNVFQGATPALFHRWVRAALAAAAKVERKDERMVFVNAWNEWAEGTYLEPDRWFGYGFGQALRTAVAETAPRLAPAAGRAEVVEGRGGRAKAVVLLHLHYPELIEEFATRLADLEPLADLAVSFTDTWTPEDATRLAAAFPKARLAPYANTGRDMAPFIGELRWAQARGYDVFCKLHSKRSPHLAYGDAWRRDLLAPLLDDPAAVVSAFDRDASLGLLAATDARMRLGDAGVMHNNAATMATLGKRLGFNYDDDTAFPAGSMFWGRTKAFHILTASDFNFEPELGRIDGTLAHALERSMAALVAGAGYRADWTLA
jgi:lipopolysaccharide biosynthesis protein